MHRVVILEKMGQASSISTLHFAKGYYQVLRDPSHKEKTTFIMEWGKLNFTVMPFDLQNGPATIQCLMDVVLRDTFDYSRWFDSLWQLDFDVQYRPGHRIRTLLPSPEKLGQRKKKFHL